ncbi:hypothetical protein HYH02_014702 [Chlamydomonas schloesseri]|uniref:CCB2 n=1 Tax=Chlamydomonas schloesseri TaxID=2026947 RepID=A0A835SH19_9CHLO|nr:hypothetical protein HYH02_014702 [Chlamydomonas schloesseri]|eukprot:KAG2426849.1 hypothetical protein HYH02_014702 [Chlamydomonas schloesseri]
MCALRHRALRQAAPCKPPVVSRRTTTQVRAETQRRGGLGDDDIDVAVFRFTLGIPGFDDRLIPRVVGFAIGALLVLNHVLGADPTPDAQTRSEWLGALLAALCVLVPDIEERLREAMPGRGRQKAADAIAGSANGFFLEPSLPEAAKKELAWASFSLLKNTNCCGVAVAAGGKVLMARGALGAGVVTPGNAAASLAAMSKDLAALPSSSKVAEAVAGGAQQQQQQQLWLPDRGGFGGAGAGSLALVPEGAQCLLVQHMALPGGGPAALIVYSERPRALADRERGWVTAVANKLAAFV